MIDAGNLQAASLYINNQLLSRGLVRDGQGIDFTMLGFGHGGSAETSRKIIGVINDLILRRDRDAESRESLSIAMRDLRAENLKSADDVNRLTEKAAEAQRRFEIATASENSMRTQLRSAESAMRSLKEELARTKALVAQARAACATEIKRRDRQIDTLKKQVGEAGRTRGAKGNAAVMTITVTGDVGGGDDKHTRSRSSRASEQESSLRVETNTFLASVAQNLSEENESLLRTMKDTMEQLREMSGWVDEEEEDGNDDEADAQVVRQPCWEELSEELDAVMEHMRSILTNPSFVPIEEVLVREDEIDRLKDGWIKMESRWEDAVHLMDAWRKRMVVTGKPVNEEDLKIGMSLSPIQVRNVEETRHARRPGLSEVETPRPGYVKETRRDVPPASPTPAARRRTMPVALVVADNYAVEDESGEASDSEFNGFDDEILLDEHGVQIIDGQRPAEEKSMRQRVLSPESSPLPEPPQLSRLKASSSAVNRQSRTVTVPVIKFRQPLTRKEESGNGFGPEPEPKPELEPEPKVEPEQKPEPEKLGPEKLVPRKVKIPFGGASDSRTRSSSSSHSRSRSRRAPIFPSPEDELTTQPRDEPWCRQEGEKRASVSHQMAPPPRRATRSSAVRSSNTDSGEAPSETEPPSMTTIAAKLAASEKEADAARARAKLRSARAAAAVAASAADPAGSGVRTRAGPREQREQSRARRRDVEGLEQVKQEVGEEKEKRVEQKLEKRRTERRASRTMSRRRSTLNRVELDTLMVGNAQ